jgi:hypothetical protein
MEKSAMASRSDRGVCDFPLTSDLSTTHGLRNDVLRLALAAKHRTEKGRNNFVCSLGRLRDQIVDGCSGLTGDIYGLTGPKLVDDRLLSVGQACLRLRRDFADDGKNARSCGSGTLPSRVERDGSGSRCRSTENVEDVEGLVRLAVRKLQDFLDRADAERVLNKSEVHLVAQSHHVSMEVRHGDEKVVEAALVNGIEIL